MSCTHCIFLYTIDFDAYTASAAKRCVVYEFYKWNDQCTIKIGIIRFNPFKCKNLGISNEKNLR